ncbi:MAG: dTDP-4-dehydrorhamnose 3,5-epimerase [Candidatus Acidiferrum sp.]
MQRIETSLPGVFELRPVIHRDARGFFIETYHQAKYADFGITDTFLQDNHSCSVKGTLRGLHYQLRRPQAKLCRIVEGEALDVAVDIRLGSPNFAKWTSVLLSAEQQNQIYVPVGFAHGYLALSETVQFLYKCSDFYNPGDEHGVAWNDPDLRIAWNAEEPTVSARDSKFMPLAQVPHEFLPEYRVK